MYKILIIEDDLTMAQAIQKEMKMWGNDAQYVQDFKNVLETFAEFDPHLVLMDIMMPEMDGITAMLKIREVSNVPVILLTAKSEDTDKVLGLTVGADDYVTKPFNTVELQARVKSQLRRYMKLGGGTVRPDTIVIGGIELNDVTKEVTLDGDKVQLTRTEYDILKLLMEHPGEVFSRTRFTNRYGRIIPTERRIRWRYISGICGKKWSITRQNRGI